MPSTISRLYPDLRDGLYLLKIEDEIKPGAVNWSRVHKSYDKWQRHMRCMENCAYAVDVGSKKLNYSLVRSIFEFLVNFIFFRLESTARIFTKWTEQERSRFCGS